MLRTITVNGLLLGLLCLACSLTSCVPSGIAEAADRSGPHFQRSYALEARGEFRAALEAMKQVAPAQRKGYVFVLRQGWLQYRAGDYRTAIDAYRRAVRLAPKAIEPRLGLMLPQMALRLWKDASETGRAALKRDPLNYLATSRLALSQYSLGRYQQAAQLYRKLLGLYPGDVEMRAGLGWSLLRLGRKKEARAALDAVLAVAPAHVSAKQGLAALRAAR